MARSSDALDAAGCADDTVVLVTSDNGPWLGADRHGGGRVSMRRFNGPFRGQKQEVLEGGIRVPAIVRWPDGLPAGAACDEMIHFCDWLPTLAAAAGVSADGLPLDGCNQLPRLRGTPEAGAPPRFWQFNRYDPVPGCNLAMRDGPWKLYWPRIPEAMVKLPEDNAAVRELMTRPHYEMPVSNPPVERMLSAVRGAGAVLHPRRSLGGAQLGRCAPRARRPHAPGRRELVRRGGGGAPRVRRQRLKR